MTNARVARRYATALMTAAEEAGTLERTAADLELLGQVLRDSRELRMVVASPVVSAARKTAVFTALFGPHMSPGTVDFLCLMTAKGREGLLPEVVEQFFALRDERMGIVTVEVTSAVEIVPPQQRDLGTALERTTGKRVRVRFALDSSIRGGLVVKIGDTVLDASLRRQLELLRSRLVAGGPLAN